MAALQLRPRHQAVARALADAFGVDTEEALAAVRHASPELGDFLAGAGPAHLFAFYQATHDGSGSDGADADGEPAPPTTTTTGGRHVTHAPRPHHRREFFFAHSGRVAPGAKAVYFLRASPDGGPLDLDKVRARRRC